jgi:hypothetical protein
MTTQGGTDLGHGVRVVEGDGNGVVVLSEALDLGWRPREGARPGSAVVWRETGFQVASMEPWRRGARWILEPWSDHDVMRVVLPLDEASVRAAAERAARDRAEQRLRPVMWLLMPVLGFAAASWQRRWRDEWGFPAAKATVASGLGETLFGAMCGLELMASMAAGSSVFPWLPRPLVVVGFAFFVEGLIRLKLVAADSEPVGSALGSVLLAFSPDRPAPPPPSDRPEVSMRDPEGEQIEVVTATQRHDLESPGVLPYRGRSYRLSRTDRLGDRWVYRFSLIPSDDEAPRLRLMPTTSKPVERTGRDSPGLIRTVLLTVVTTMAPARHQRLWADEIDMNPLWLTVIGGSAELVGGLVNLRSLPAGDPTALLLNLFLAGEGALRLVTVLGRKRLLGSVLGWPLTPVLDRVLARGTAADR